MITVTYLWVFKGLQRSIKRLLLVNQVPFFANFVIKDDVDFEKGRQELWTYLYIRHTYLLFLGYLHTEITISSLELVLEWLDIGFNYFNIHSVGIIWVNKCNLQSLANSKRIYSFLNVCSLNRSLKYEH